MKALGACPLCKREMVPGKSVDQHHLIPKLKGGTETIYMHKICHRKIHSLFTEGELKNYYHTIERLLEHEDIKSFVRWIQNKPLEFNDSHRVNHRKK